MGVNAKLSDLQSATTLAGGELIYVVQGGNSRQATLTANGAGIVSDTGVIGTTGLALLADETPEAARKTVAIFDTVADLVADTTMGYSGATITVSAGDIVRAGKFDYEVQSSGASGAITNANATPVQMDPDSPIFGVSPEQVGATVDGSTDNQAKVEAARVVGGAIELSADTYYLSTQQEFDEAVMVRGQGKDKTKVILDCSGSAGLLYSDGANHCSVKNLTLQGNDLTAPLIQLGTGASGENVVSDVFENVRFMGNSGGGQPAFSDTAHVAVRMPEATGGGSNYFHRFDNCDFDSVFSPFDADFNGNACFVTNMKAQRVWRVFTGGFQLWVVNNVFWHFSSGSGSDYATFLKLTGKSASNKAQYNQFFNIMAEPGTTLTRFIDLDANTQGNGIVGDHQCTENGTDSGTNNRQVRPIIGRHEIGGEYSWRYSGNLTFGFTGGNGDVRFFGDGTTSYTGTDSAGRKLILHGGFTAETRRGELKQVPGGAFTMENFVAGKVKLIGIDGIELDMTSSGLTLTGATTQSTVGAAGGADAVPANPTTYLVVNIGGTNYAIPAFAAS